MLILNSVSNIKQARSRMQFANSLYIFFVDFIETTFKIQKRYCFNAFIILFLFENLLNMLISTRCIMWFTVGDRTRRSIVAVCRRCHELSIQHFLSNTVIL